MKTLSDKRRETPKQTVEAIKDCKHINVSYTHIESRKFGCREEVKCVDCKEELENYYKFNVL